MAERQEKLFELANDAHEYYVDSVNVSTQLYGSTLYLGQIRPDQLPEVKAVVKISPPMLKILSLIIASHVRQYETGVGPIPVPRELLHSLGLEEML